MGGSMNQELERDIDPPEPVRYDMTKIKSWWIGIKWDDGTTEEIALPEEFRQAGRDIEGYLDEIEIERNRDILQNQALKYGDPDSDY